MTAGAEPKRRGRKPMVVRLTPYVGDKELELARKIVAAAVHEVRLRYKLSDQQEQLLFRVAMGKTRTKSGRERKVSENTVRSYMQTVYRKIGVKKLGQLIPVLLVAYEHALVRGARLRTGAVSGRVHIVREAEHIPPAA